MLVFDAGYDPLQLAVALDDIAAAILVRLRRGRCFYADPPAYGGAGHAHPGRGQRLPGRTQEPQVLWLWWHGLGTPDLAVVWRA